MLIALKENMINVFKLWAIMVTIMVQPSELAKLALHGDCAGNLIISACLIYVMFNLCYIYYLTHHSKMQLLYC